MRRPLMGMFESAAVLSVEGARRSFEPGRPALDGVSLALCRGELLALLGPNGAGKTTLIRAICGRVRLEQGEVRLDGSDPRREPKSRRRLGLVPQELALYPELTCRENLEVLGGLAGLDRRSAGRAAREWLEWVGLADRAASLARDVSGGMKRRLNLAAGVLHEPRVLLLDEPTVGVDPQARERIHERLRDLRRRGMAILLATHDLEQAAELADRVAIQVEGRIAATGTVRQLVECCFGPARELSLTLASEPAAPGRAALEAEGLSATTSGLTWLGRLTGDLEALAALGRRLALAGLAVGELRVREPGLRGVFFRIAGRELDD